MNVGILQNNYDSSDSILLDSSGVSESVSESSNLLDSSDSVDYSPYFVDILDNLELISSKYSEFQSSEDSEKTTIDDLNHTLQWTNTFFIVLILVIIGRSISNRVHLM